LGQNLDPNNSLYSLDVADAAESVVVSAAEMSQAQPIDPDATMVFSAPPPMEEPPAEPVVSSDEVATLDFDLDLGEPDGTGGPTETLASETVDTSSGLDFDLDLGEPAAAESVAATVPDIVLDAPVSEVAAESNDAMALDIDFDLDAPAVAEVPVIEVLDAGTIAFESTPTPSAVEAETLALDIDFDAPAVSDLEPKRATADEANVVDFDLDIELPSAAAGHEMEAPATDLSALALDVSLDVPEVVATPADTTSSPALDFDFDLGEPESASASVAPQSVAEPALTPPVLDLSSISLDLDAPSESPSAVELESAVTEVSVAEPAQPDNPEAATKLELALAYEEMGDRDGARELLEEVVAEGSPAQRELAQTKLDSLG
jgi:pilus assembly protein FimV